jgi:hypothetical protein
MHAGQKKWNLLPIEKSACNTSLKLNVNKTGGLIATDVEDCGEGIQLWELVCLWLLERIGHPS